MTGTTIANKTTIATNLTAHSQSPLTIATTGSIYPASGSYAVLVAAGVFGAMTNLGRIESYIDGVQILGGLALVNGSSSDPTATIKAGYAGVVLGPAADALITNFGTIAGASPAYNGGASYGVMSSARPMSLINGSASDTTALVSGATNGVFAGAGLALANFGTIVSAMVATKARTGAETAVFGFGRDSITNGAAASDTVASIAGWYAGIRLSGPQSQIANFGTIAARDPNVLANFVPVGQAVAQENGGTLVNGSPLDQAATIIGARIGVQIAGQGGTVSNFGTIAGTDALYGAGVQLAAGGMLTNGGLLDTAALIQAGGGFGIDMAGARPSSVINYGTVQSTGGVGVQLQAGAVVNGTGADTLARIAGYAGIYALTAVNITNHGDIVGTGSNGVELLAGGGVYNARSGSITGGNAAAGVSIYSGTATVTNFGTIIGGTGVAFDAGVALSATGTVVNRGLIASTAGTSGTALQFGTGAATLVLGPGGQFIGHVAAGGVGNTLELIPGYSNGTVNGMGTQITGFDTVTVDAGGHWAINGDATIAQVNDNGSLAVTGSVEVGTLAMASNVGMTVTGSLDVAFWAQGLTDTLSLAANTTLEIGNMLGENGSWSATTPTIVFLANDEVILDSSINFNTVSQSPYNAPRIEGFKIGDSIDLKGVPLLGPLRLNGNELVLNAFVDPHIIGMINVSSSYYGTPTFHASSDAVGGTLLKFY